MNIRDVVGKLFLSKLDKIIYLAVLVFYHCPLTFSFFSLDLTKTAIVMFTDSKFFEQTLVSFCKGTILVCMKTKDNLGTKDTIFSKWKVIEPSL